MNYIINLLFNKNYFDRNYINILIVIDRLIKMIKYIFINKIDVIFTTRVFYLWIWKNYDFSTIIISDRDIQFKFDFWY